MSPAGDIWPFSGVQVSWYCLGSQLASAAIFALPMTAACLLLRVMASSANQEAKALPPPAAVSAANLASRLKRKAVPGESVGSVSGFAEGFARGLSAICAGAVGPINSAEASKEMVVASG